MNLVGGIDMQQIVLIYFLNAPLYPACCLSLRCLFGHSCTIHFIFENLKMATQLLKTLTNLCHLSLVPQFQAPQDSTPHSPAW